MKSERTEKLLITVKLRDISVPSLLTIVLFSTELTLSMILGTMRLSDILDPSLVILLRLSMQTAKLQEPSYKKLISKTYLLIL
jgi:hypothetical protein